MSSLRKYLILSATAVALAGCGVRGPLEPPPGAAAPDHNEPAAVDPLIKPE